MPGSFRFNNTVLYITMEGKHTSEEFLEIMTSALSDPDCPEKVGLLVDGRNASFNPPSAELRQLVDRMAKFEKLGRRALVASDDFLFALGRMAGAFEELEGKEMRVFKELNEAEAWLLEE